MTEPKSELKSDDVSPAPRRRPGATGHGFVPDDQPIYSRSWNFLEQTPSDQSLSGKTTDMSCIFCAGRSFLFG